MKRILVLVRKDVSILRRSPLVLTVLVAYPLAVAILVGVVTEYASAKPRVALVDEDGLPAVVHVGGLRFNVDATIRRVARDVELERRSAEDARRDLRRGRVVAVVTVPRGFVDTLQGMVESPRLELEVTRGPVSSRVRQQVQALVYALNRRLQRAYIRANLGYVGLLQHGGGGRFLGRDFEVLGLDGTQAILEQFPRGSELDRIREFIATARLALAQTGDSLRATANPIELREVSRPGRTRLLSAQIQADALAVTITFLALVLAAAALAAERDENVIGRLAQGRVRLRELVAAKIVLAGLLALALGLAIALGFGVVTELLDARGGEPWARLPVLLAGVALAGMSVGALGVVVGALARDARTASLVAILVVLPIVFLGLVPAEVAPAAAAVSDAFPFAHAVDFFEATLYEPRPWRTLALEALWLLALGAAFSLAGRAAAPRLVA